jgi:hypothetical protein
MAEEINAMDDSPRSVATAPGPTQRTEAEEAFLGSDQAGSDRKMLFGLERATAMMALMFLGGIGWVLFASQQVGIVEVSEEEDPNVAIVQAGLLDIRQTAQANSPQDQSTRRIMDAIYYDVKQRQIPPDDIHSNPFTYHILPEPKEPEPEPVVTPDEPADQPEPVVEAPPPVEGLSLQSVLMGANPTAMISGTLVRRGQIIQGWEVVEIQQDRVKLKWRNRVYWLKMP